MADLCLGVAAVRLGPPRNVAVVNAGSGMTYQLDVSRAGSYTAKFQNVRFAQRDRTVNVTCNGSLNRRSVSKIAIDGSVAHPVKSEYWEPA